MLVNKSWICSCNNIASPVFQGRNICRVKPGTHAAEKHVRVVANAAAPPGPHLRAPVQASTDRWLDRVDGAHVCDWEIATLWIAAERNMIWMQEWNLNLISVQCYGPRASLLYLCPWPAVMWPAAAVLSGACSHWGNIITSNLIFQTLLCLLLNLYIFFLKITSRQLQAGSLRF